MKIITLGLLVLTSTSVFASTAETFLCTNRDNPKEKIYFEKKSPSQVTLRPKLNSKKNEVLFTTLMLTEPAPMYHNEKGDQTIKVWEDLKAKSSKGGTLYLWRPLNRADIFLCTQISAS